MKKKASFLVIFSALLSFAYLPRLGTPVPLQGVPNPDHMIVATIGEPDTVDPTWAYYTASSELIFNVYETLVFYDRESVDEFIPMLTTDWHTSEDGLTYTFKIRQGVRFHNGEILTAEDVEYSFERTMVQDIRGGLGWMLYEALLGRWEANLTDPEWDAKIDNAVQRNTTHFWFNLVKPYAPFLQILCQPWSSIVNKKFCVEHGDWPGTWDNWQDYHDPDVSPLDSPEPAMCGTGPYKFDYWTKGWEWSVTKFNNYWGGWPAPDSQGYVSRATVRWISDWPPRYDGFMAGDYDMILVPREYIEEVEGAPGVRCVKDLPVLHCNTIFFTFDINTTSPYMGVPGGLTLGTFNETGIPPDFFSDTNIRKAFAYSFNWTQYIEEVYYGEAIQPATPVIEGLPYRNSTQEKYSLNLSKAETCFKKAWDGQVWKEGFTMTLLYHIGALPRFTWIDILKQNVESLNPKFHINMEGIHWTPLLTHLVHSELPMFLLSWLAYYPDPHNFVMPFMHSEGDFAYFQRYSSPTVDTLVEEGLKTMNTTRRKEIYYELQSIYHKDCPSVPTVQVLKRHWERDWVQGWYYNPAYPGNYFYHLWKQSILYGDLNNDGIVDIYDVVAIALAFGSEPGDPSWNPLADLVQDGVIDIFDVVSIARNFGKTD